MTDAPDGSVPRTTVIKVLEAVADECGYSIKASTASVTLVKGGIPVVYDLPPDVGRRMLGVLTGKFGVKPEYFYHPEMCCGGNLTKH